MTAEGLLQHRFEVAVRAGLNGFVEAMDIAARNAAPDGLTRPAFVGPLRRLLVDREADGSLHSKDPDEDATLLYNLVGHMRTGHGWSPQRARDAVLRLAFEGIQAR